MVQADEYSNVVLIDGFWKISAVFNTNAVQMFEEKYALGLKELEKKFISVTRWSVTIS